ncbi:MAG: helix-turn-helix domain-containing protein [Chloroflexota bacterium]|nr:helix-turn-helix domain-containing protein [Chloroflexota bacterium]MDE2940969.1 helix-turn-helix domain-containing protein [Chloroflexota bacterium]
MLRQRVNYSVKTYEVPEDFPERLVRFQEESGLSWAEIARRLGAHPYTVRRWVLGRARPSMA